MTQTFSRYRRVEDYYILLGVDDDASESEIKRSYRKLAEKFHPDRTATSDEFERKLADKMMRKLNAAKHTLLDPEEREKYDRWLRYSRRKFGGARGTGKNGKGTGSKLPAVDRSTTSIPIVEPKLEEEEKGPTGVLEMELVEENDEDVVEGEPFERMELVCPGCHKAFWVDENSEDEYDGGIHIECPHCGLRGLMEKPSNEETVEMTCPVCEGKFRIRMGTMTRRTVIQCPHCGAKGMVDLELRDPESG